MTTRYTDAHRTVHNVVQSHKAKPKTHATPQNGPIAKRYPIRWKDSSGTTGKKSHVGKRAFSTLHKVDAKVQTQRKSNPTSEAEAEATYDLTDFAEENDSKIYLC